MGDRVTVIAADLTAPLTSTPEIAMRAGQFAHVVANPPYMTEGRGTPASDPIRAGANAMAADGLDAWARFLSAMAAPRGTLTLIHRADALATILAALDGRFGAVRVFPLFPRSGAAASRIIVTATKGHRAPLSLLPGLVLHDDMGCFTPRTERLLRNAVALELEG